MVNDRKIYLWFLEKKNLSVYAGNLRILGFYLFSMDLRRNLRPR